MEKLYLQLLEIKETIQGKIKMLIDRKEEILRSEPSRADDALQNRVLEVLSQLGPSSEFAISSALRPEGYNIDQIFNALVTLKKQGKVKQEEDLIWRLME